MCLYYVHDASNSYHLVVYATCRWNARHKASEWMHKEYDVNISIYDWLVEPCDHNAVIE